MQKSEQNQRSRRNFCSHNSPTSRFHMKPISRMEDEWYGLSMLYWGLIWSIDGFNATFWLIENHIKDWTGKWNRFLITVSICRFDKLKSFKIVFESRISGKSSNNITFIFNRLVVWSVSINSCETFNFPVGNHSC